MKGTVIHSRGHYRRFLEGRDNDGHLSVKAIMPVPQAGEPSGSQSRPVYFVFYCDGKSFAGSQKVVLTKGRRYPDVEHWFILPNDVDERSIDLPAGQCALQTFSIETNGISAAD